MNVHPRIILLMFMVSQDSLLFLAVVLLIEPLFGIITILGSFVGSSLSTYPLVITDTVLLSKIRSLCPKDS